MSINFFESTEIPERQSVTLNEPVVWDPGYLVPDPALAWKFTDKTTS